MLIVLVLRLKVEVEVVVVIFVAVVVTTTAAGEAIISSYTLPRCQLLKRWCTEADSYYRLCPYDYCHYHFYYCYQSRVARPTSRDKYASRYRRWCQLVRAWVNFLARREWCRGTNSNVISVFDFSYRFSSIFNSLLWSCSHWSLIFSWSSLIFDSVLYFPLFRLLSSLFDPLLTFFFFLLLSPPVSLFWFFYITFARLLVLCLSLFLCLFNLFSLALFVRFSHTLFFLASRRTAQRRYIIPVTVTCGLLSRDEPRGQQCLLSGQSIKPDRFVLAG